jgi:hypothetical protein
MTLILKLKSLKRKSLKIVSFLINLPLSWSKEFNQIQELLDNPNLIFLPDTFEIIHHRIKVTCPVRLVNSPNLFLYFIV